MELKNYSRMAVNYCLGAQSGVLQPRESINVEPCGLLELAHTQDSYYCNMRKEKNFILRFLSRIADPFKLIKEYHVMVASTFDLAALEGGEQVILGHRSVPFHGELTLYYEHFTLTPAGGSALVPCQMAVPDPDSLTRAFRKTNGKWKAWDIISEVLFDVIFDFFFPNTLSSILLLVCLFVAFGAEAWLYILGFTLLIFLLEFVAEGIFIHLTRDKPKDTEKFKFALEPRVILNECYYK